MDSSSLQDDAAASILADCQRSTSLDSLLPYNEEAVSRILAQIQHLNAKVLQHVEALKNAADAATAWGAVVVYHTTILRNKRILLAYLMHRIRTIQGIRYYCGSVCPSHILANMSDPEQLYFKAYDKLVSGYMRNVGLDLTMDLAGPPKDLFIEVRVLKDLGEIGLSNGSFVRLDRGTTHFLKRTDVDPLIRQGLVKRTG